MPKTHKDIWQELKRHLTLAEQAEVQEGTPLHSKVAETMNQMIKAEALGGSKRIVLYGFHFVSLLKLFPEAYNRYCYSKEFGRSKP